MTEGAARWHAVRRALASEAVRDYAPDYINALRENLRDAQARQARTSLLTAVAITAFMLLLGSKIGEIRIAGLQITDLKLPATLLPAIIAYLAYEGWFTLRYIQDRRLLLSEVVASAFPALETQELVDTVKPWNGAFVTDLSELEAASSFHPVSVTWLVRLHTWTLRALMFGTTAFVVYCYWRLFGRTGYSGPWLVASAVVAGTYLIRIALVWAVADPAHNEHALEVVERYAPGDYSDFSDDAVEGVLEIMATNAMFKLIVETAGKNGWRAAIYDPLLPSANNRSILCETHGDDRRAAMMALLRRIEKKDGWWRRDETRLMSVLLAGAPLPDDGNGDHLPSWWRPSRRIYAIQLRHLNHYLAKLKVAAQEHRDRLVALGEDSTALERSRESPASINSLQVGPKSSISPWRRQREQRKLQISLAEYAVNKERLEVKRLESLVHNASTRIPGVEVPRERPMRDPPEPPRAPS